MELKTYCEARHGAQSHIAKLIGAQPQLVWQWVSGSRPVPLERCVAIERATDGSVMRWDLRPIDWHDIWPELVARPDAPPVCDKNHSEELIALTAGSSDEPAAAEVQMSRRAA